jgi:hypothetical protein
MSDSDAFDEHGDSEEQVSAPPACDFRGESRVGLAGGFWPR